jgi:hypothetical protein
MDWLLLNKQPLPHTVTGTSWEFSQNLLLDHVEKDVNLSLREVFMGIQSSKFTGKSVFHTVDPAWGSDNAPSFWRMKQKPECILQVWCPKSGILLGSPSLDLSQLMPLIDMLTLILTQSQTKFFYDGCMDTKLTSLG